jgi:sec-independent protein translocase protein TatC
LNEDEETNFTKLLPHLEELRFRIVVIVFILIAASSVAFFLTPYTFKLLKHLAPEGATFFQIKPGELFYAYLKLTILQAVFIGAPFILQQIASFLWPGLKTKERKIASLVLFGGPVLFNGGMVFAYFVAIKPMIGFLLGFGVQMEMVQATYSIEEYLSVVTGLLLVFGFAFELPILIILLAILKLIDSQILIKYWKQIVFGILILSAVITPTPDPFNMLVLGASLILLYLGSILFIKLIVK